MTEVTETITRPGGAAAAGVSVRYELVGAGRAFVSADDETVVGRQPTITADVNGEYTIDLPPNTSLNPAGTRWRRSVIGPGFEAFVDDIIVPVGGGPHVVEDILAESLTPVPEPTPTNLIDEAVRTTDSANLNVDAFTGALVPLTIVTVPDLAIPTLLRGHGAMIHSVANSMCGLAIVPEGGVVGSRVDIGYGYNGTPATNPATGYPEAKLDPHSPGNYQLMVYSFTTGTVRLAGSNAQKSWLRVFSA